jgi:uncharacterized Zn finger protein
LPPFGKLPTRYRFIAHWSPADEDSQGSRKTPYKIKIQIAHLTDAQWDKVFDALAEQAIFSAQLLAGEMPQDIEQAFETANVSLFPSKRNDLQTNCSCSDYANPGKHIAATHYILGERFDEDPFLIFRLRSRNQEQVIHALRQRRASNHSYAAHISALAKRRLKRPTRKFANPLWLRL